jgi:hypothetical protein
MRNVKLLSLAMLVLIATAACASKQTPVAAAPEVAPAPEIVAKPSFSASQTDTVTAVVQSINYETREVTLVDDMGDTIDFIAGDKVRNLEQVSVGDILVAEHVESVSIEVMPGDGLGPEQVEMLATARAEKGQMPGAMAIDSVVIASVIKAINLDNSTVILEGADGNLEEYVAINPENLKRVEIGDVVVMTITESLAIAVEKVE